LDPLQVKFTAAKNAMTDPRGTLQEALEGNILNVKHCRLLPLRDLPLGKIFVNLSDSQKTRFSKALEVFPAGLPMHR